MRTSDLSPDCPEFAAVLFGLGLVDVANAFTGIEFSGLLLLHVLELQKDGVVHLIPLGPAEGVNVEAMA